MEKYNLVYTKSAIKDIKRLDSVVKKRINSKIKIYHDHPIRNAKKLQNRELGTYRWKIGNHRVIFDIDKNNIVILRIGHRREVYK